MVAPHPPVSRITCADRRGRALRRAGLLTPYLLEIITEDALRAGPGGRLDIEVLAGTRETLLVDLRERLAALARRGLKVRVRRTDPLCCAPRPHTLHKGRPDSTKEARWGTPWRKGRSL
jgi:hypothetical protein